MLKAMKKAYLVVFLSIVFVMLSTFVVWFSLSATSSQQEIRGQAYGEGGTTCDSQKPINTQFRPYEANTDKPWTSGTEITKLHYQPGQHIDVNCFAKNGTALLVSGVIDLTDPDGRTTRVSNSPALRNYVVVHTGTYTFKCSSTTIASCGNTDSFEIGQKTNPPTPSPSPNVPFSPADVNKDGKVTIEDYALFLTDYRQRTGL